LHTTGSIKHTAEAVSHSSGSTEESCKLHNTSVEYSFIAVSIGAKHVKIHR